jgi:uncharacterized membrane protein (DUF2068 family)
MERSRVDLVPAIGVFKLCKAVLLVAAAVALLFEAPQQLVAHLEHILQVLGIGAGRRTVEELLQRLWRLDNHTENRVAFFALAYAGVFIIEGIGLLFRRRWAEWLTVFVTASFIPFEVYELVRHFGPGKLVALVLNIAIVAYLVWRRLEDRAGLATRLRALTS